MSTPAAKAVEVNRSTYPDPDYGGKVDQITYALTPPGRGVPYGAHPHVAIHSSRRYPEDRHVTGIFACDGKGTITDWDAIRLHVGNDIKHIMSEYGYTIEGES